MVNTMNSNPNDLLERYLQAVGQYLPASTREDTLAELRTNLLEQMDARSEELARPLNEAEVATILRAHGRPEVVAVRYLPQQSLIGPGIFPIYLLTLKRALPFVVLIYLGAQFLPMVFSGGSDFHAKQIIGPVLQLIPTLFIFWGVVTIVFTVLDFVGKKNGKESCWPATSGWDPADLPPVTVEVNGIKRRSLASRVADLVVHCFWMLYVLAIPAHPYLLIGPGVNYIDSHGIRFAGVWRTFFTLLIALLLTHLIMKVIAIGNQYQSSLLPLQFMTTLLGLFATGIMATSSEYFVAVSSAANLSSLGQVNYAMSIAFRIATFFAAVGVIVEGWKYLKHHFKPQSLVF